MAFNKFGGLVVCSKYHEIKRQIAQQHDVIVSVDSSLTNNYVPFYLV